MGGEGGEVQVVAGHDAVLRLRASSGLRPRHVVQPSGGGDEAAAASGVIALPMVDRHLSFALELSHDPKVPLYVRGGCVFLQSVLLFSVGNERRIRVLTRPLQVVEHLPRLAQSIHLPTCLSLQTKQAAAALAKQPAKAVADKLQADAVAALSAQRELLPPPFQKVADAMFLTQTLALLPLFTLALARLPSLNPLQPHSLSLSPDAAAAQLLALRLLPPHLSSRILLPRVHALHLRSEGEGFLAPPPPPAPPATEKASPAAASPAASPATATAAAADGAAGASALAGWRELPMPSSAAVAQDGVYLLDSLEQLVLWVGAQAHPTFLEGLFGTATPADGAAPLPAAATPQARALHAALAELRAGRPLPAPLKVVVQGSPRQQALFFGRLHAEGYEAFALHLHNRQVEHYRRRR